MTSDHDDGMDWLADAELVEVDEHAEALAGVASAARAALFNLVRGTFDELAKTEGLTRREVADRLGLPSPQVSRLLRSPTNMTVETAARVMYVMGRELWFTSEPPANLTPSVQTHVASLASILSGQGALMWSWQHVRNVSLHGRLYETKQGVKMMHVDGCSDHVDGVWEQLDSKRSVAAGTKSSVPVWIPEHA